MLINTKFLNVLFLVLLFSFSAMAQGEKTENNENNRQGGWWTIGINAGSSYQTSDVCSEYNGWGMGLTLAKNLYYRPGAFLAFDLRGRLLYANQKGQDWERSTGLQFNQALNGNDTRDFSIGNSLNYYDPLALEPSHYYANHRTDLLELGLEGVINLNRLKEKTNVIVNLYGGLNLDWYKTRINQSNDRNSRFEYDYSTIPTTDRSSTTSALNSIMDDSYETVADGFDKEYGTFTWMPSAGLELGYQFTPRFSMVLGHKVTWSRADIMDGQQWNNDNTATGNNDLYHYTHLGLRWIIEPGEKTIEPPIIRIIKPQPLPHATQVAYVQVKAEIENVQSASNVNCTFNGNNFNNFNFNPKSENFACNLNLVPGRNVLVINATNMAGQDTEDVVIIYNEPVIPPTPDRIPPVVNITRPSSSGTTVANPSYNLNAIVKHVDSRNNIRFTLNGSTVSNYSYSFSTDQLEATLALQPGRNTVKITGTNSDGADSDQTIIIYEAAEVSCPEPAVNISSLSTPSGRNRDMKLAAIVRYVNKKSQINLYLNGNRVSNFAFNPSNGSVTATLQAKNGTNNVRLVANTDCGRDEDVDNVNYTAPSNPGTPAPCPNPTVNIDNISVPVATNANNAKSTLNATTRNVSRKNQIQLYVNGNRTYSFSFNASSGTISATLNLKEGNNNVKVSVSTNCGNDQDSQNVSFSSTTTPNPSVQPPLVDISTPNNGITTSSSTVKIVASVKYVDGKNNIKVTLNGVNYTSFSYNSNTKVLTMNNTPIRLGSNIIEIKATNNAGTDSDDVTIIREDNTPAPCPNPTVNIDNISIPAATPMSPNNAKSTLMATATNVTSKNQITLTVNGSNINNFTFNAASGIITSSLDFIKGNNVIKIIVTTNCGSDQDTDNIDFSTQAPTPKPVVNITKPSNNASFNTSTTQLSATVKNVTKKKDVIVKVNGELQTSFAFNANTGLVTATIKLNEGRNTIIVSASNVSGSDSDSKSVTYVKPVTIPKPVVNITKPSNNASFNIPSTQLSATVKNVTKKKDIVVKVNGQLQTSFAFNGSSGLVTSTIRLNEGRNTIIVSASNVSGSDSDSKSVTYVKPSQPKPPVVTITKPTNKSTVKTNKVNLVATVKNVTKKSDVTVKLNGASISNFNFSGTSVTALLTIKEGNNRIVVIGNNTDGQDQASVTVKYVKATPPPTVNITKPAKTVRVIKPAFVVKATLTNVAVKKDVKFTLNGKNITVFTYNSTTGKLTATIRLKSGKNTIVVTGVNSAGQDSDTKIVNYVAVAKPKIEIQNISIPAATPMSPNNAKSSLTAKATGVAAKKDILLKVNNVKITNFTFNKTTGIITSQLDFVKGKNTIFIEVKNAAGTTSAEDEVNF
ncbi:MAG: hypothetical protein ACI94Y_000752 [Maribacter sp.]|jgi:hypothetical protein